MQSIEAGGKACDLEILVHSWKIRRYDYQVSAQRVSVTPVECQVVKVEVLGVVVSSNGVE